MKPLRKICTYVVLYLAVLLYPVHVDAQIAGGGAVIASAGVIKVMLSNLIQQATDEVESIFNSTLNQVEALESGLIKDLSELESATFEDLDELTYDRMTQLDNMLQSIIGQLLEAERTINEDIARQIQYAVIQANTTWSNISADLDNKIYKIQEGVLIVVDSVALMTTRIIFIVFSFLLVIFGVFLLRKYKKPGIISLVLGSLLLIFSLTPFFTKTISGLGFYGDKFKLDGKTPAPFIITTWPRTLSLAWNQTGEIALLGTNFTSKVGASTILFGTQQDHLNPIPNQVSFTTSTATFQIDGFTGNSGTYYIQIQRSDTTFSDILSIYVKQPEEIPIRIDYKIWQKGTWLAYGADILQVREVHRCCRLCSGTKSFEAQYTNAFWDVYDYSKSEINDRYFSDLNETLNQGDLNVSFNLECKRWNRAGWYRADYFVNLKKEDRGDTKQIATTGTKVLYFNPETGELKARSFGFREHGSLSTFFNEQQVQLSSQPITEIKKAKHKTINEKFEELIIKPEHFVGRATDVHHFNIQQTVSTINNLPEIIASAQHLQIIPNRPNVSQEIVLGSAPSVPQFTPSQGETYYDAIVTSPNISGDNCLEKKGLCFVKDNSNNTVMTFDVRDGNLYVKWLYVPL